MFRRIYDRLIRRFKNISSVIAKHLYRFYSPDIGMPDWLIKKEIEYGGMVTNVPRNKVSPIDPRKESELRSGGMTGGDRMYDHNYAPIYAHYMSALGLNSIKVIGEFGVLKGTGLAIWCDLFPNARVLGFDIGLEHFSVERPALEGRGAFSKNRPELYEYDQLIDGVGILEKSLGNEKFDIVIDDGLHTKDAIVATFNSVKPFLAKEFVYFVEDFEDLKKLCNKELDGVRVDNYGLMSVLLPKNSDINQMT